MVCGEPCLAMGNTVICGAVSCDRGQLWVDAVRCALLASSEAIMTARHHVGASPTRDEITQAVKNLWTGDPWQYTEITVRVLGEVENIREWNEKLTCDGSLC